MKMNYFVLGTNDLPAAMQFYDAFFEGSGISKIHADDRMVFWTGEDFIFAIARPFNGEAATIGNGSMAGFNLASPGEVDRLHSKALALGGKDEGAPGERTSRYSAYVRDLDGNKICLFV